MRTNIQRSFYLTLIVVTVMIWSPCAHADAAFGGVIAISICQNIHSTNDVQQLFNELNGLLDQYEKADSPIKKKELLEKAKSIYKKLVEQANSVEAEISILTRKKLDTTYVRQVEAVLTKVKMIRMMAQKRMEKTVKAA